MMAQSRAESTRYTYNYGQYLNQFPPNTIKVIREFERIQKKICRHKMSIMFNEICINEEMLPIYIYIYICVCVCVCVFTQPPQSRVVCDTRWIFKQYFRGLISKFFFSYNGCHTKVKESCLLYNLPIAGGLIVVFISLTRVLGQCELQTASSGNRTRVTVHFHYTTTAYIVNSIESPDSHYPSLSSITPGRSSRMRPVSAQSRCTTDLTLPTAPSPSVPSISNSSYLDSLWDER